jgi:hypothetical protein
LPGTLKQNAINEVTGQRGKKYIDVWGRTGFVVQHAKAKLEKGSQSPDAARKSVQMAADNLKMALLYRREQNASLSSKSPAASKVSSGENADLKELCEAIGEAREAMLKLINDS